MGYAADRPAPGQEPRRDPSQVPLPYHASPPISPQSEAARVAGMVETILQRPPQSSAAALRELRTAFPDSPLTLRVAALELMRRRIES